MKYVKQLTNTPKNPQVAEYIKNPLYFLHGKGKKLYVTEGIADSISLSENIGCPVVSPVTTRINENDIADIVEIAKLYSSLVFVNDSEENDQGKQGAIDTIQRLQQSGVNNCYLIELPRGTGIEKIDVNDYFRTHSKDDFAKLKEYSLWEYEIESLDKDGIIQKMDEICRDVLRQSTSPNQAKLKLGSALKEKGFKASEIKEFSSLLMAKKRTNKKKALALDEINMDVPDMETVKKEVRTILYSPDGNLAMTQDTIYHTVMPHLSAVGRFLFDGNYTYYLDSRKKLHIVSEREESFQTVLGEYGIVKSRKGVYDYIVQTAMVETQINAIKSGEKATVYKFSHYDLATNTLYINNSDGRIIKVTTDNIEFVDNGHDNIIFIGERDTVPFIESSEIPSKPEQAMRNFGYEIMDSLNLQDSLITVEQQKVLATFYYLATFFDTLNPNRILLISIGPAGSGKTTLSKNMLYSIYGNKTNLLMVSKSTQSNIEYIAHNNHISVLDNLDTYIEWMNNFLASVATGGTMQVRKLYSDSTLMNIELNTWVSISSRIPRSFTRTDIADRSLYLSFSRLPEDDKISDEQFHSRIMKKRILINADVIYYLQEILNSIEQFYNDNPATDEPENRKNPLPTPIRMVDFSNFCLMASYNNKPLYDLTLSALKSLKEEQKTYMVENSNIYNTMMDYVNITPDKDSTGWTHKKTASELHKDLLSYKFKGDVDYNITAASNLGKHLMELNDLKDFIEMEVSTKGQGRTKFYRFRLVGVQENEEVDEIPF